MDKKKSGHIYILTSKDLPGIIKIGKTTRESCEHRVDKELNRGIGYADSTNWIIYNSFLWEPLIPELPDIHRLEADIKKRLKPFKHHFPGRSELFKMDPAEAFRIINSEFIKRPLTSKERYAIQKVKNAKKKEFENYREHCERLRKDINYLLSEEFGVDTDFSKTCDRIHDFTGEYKRIVGSFIGFYFFEGVVVKQNHSIYSIVEILDVNEFSAVVNITLFGYNRPVRSLRTEVELGDMIWTIEKGAIIYPEEVLKYTETLYRVRNEYHPEDTIVNLFKGLISMFDKKFYIGQEHIFEPCGFPISMFPMASTTKNYSDLSRFQADNSFLLDVVKDQENTYMWNYKPKQVPIQQRVKEEKIIAKKPGKNAKRFDGLKSICETLKMDETKVLQSLCEGTMLKGYQLSLAGSN